MSTLDSMRDLASSHKERDRVLHYEELAPDQAVLIVVKGEVNDLVMQALGEAVDRIGRYHGVKKA